MTAAPQPGTRKRAASPPDSQPEPDKAPDRILAAAAVLFAAKGFDIPLREITAEAQVNGAAVNYHFGSKANLTEVLFNRISEQVNAKRLAELDQILAAARAAGRPPQLDDIVLAFISPYLQPSQGGHLLARLILQHRVEPTDLTRQVIDRHFDPMAKRFIEAFRLAMPSVDPAEFPWRYMFMVGAVVLTVTDAGLGSRLERLSGGGANPRDPGALRRALLLFIKGGLSAAEPRAGRRKPSRPRAG